MEGLRDPVIRQELLQRRERLQTAITELDQKEHLLHLLREVDTALEKVENGTYGLCETCHESIEQDRLIVDPLLRNCLDHLTKDEKQALEHDLDLAYQIQSTLLPAKNLSLRGWSTAYHYEPAGPVSGDYCDLIIPDGTDGSFYFFIGDVTGKGMSASILMAHLHAIFRSLIHLNLPVSQLVERANRIFCEATLSTHFATLVSGRANTKGEVEISNAGHCPPILIRGEEAMTIPSSGLPIGMFCEGEFFEDRIRLSPGDTLILYTDGFSESRNPSNDLYGEERLSSLVQRKNGLSPEDLIHACLEDLRTFRSGAPSVDDLTVMVLKRVG